VTLSSNGLALLGRSDQGGRPDGTQVMVAGGYAYVAHPFNHGFSVVDVRDPRTPAAVNFVPCSPNTWSLGVQAHEGYLAVVEELDFFCLDAAQQDHFAASTAVGGKGIDSTHPVYGGKNTAYTGGLRIYDLSDPASPRPVGFCDVEGFGLHRAWWAGGRHVYASGSLDGFCDHVLVVIDVSDVTAPEVVGRYWLPGQWLAGGEERTPANRVALHHAIVADGYAYSSWRDAGFALLDVRDPEAPRAVSRLNWHPPFGGNTHTSLPLASRDLVVVADEAAQNAGEEEQKRIFVLDVRAKDHPVTVATFPTPDDQDYLAIGAPFGPHNLWENRPEGFVSDRVVFATYQSGGLRVFDLADHYRPTEVGHFLPAPPQAMADPRPGMARAVHSSDLYVSADGLVYLIDYNAGMHVLQWSGG
jgi:hypothetical protein